MRMPNKKWCAFALNLIALICVGVIALTIIKVAGWIIYG